LSRCVFFTDVLTGVGEYLAEGTDTSVGTLMVAVMSLSGFIDPGVNYIFELLLVRHWANFP
jgi:hypothetical protein